MNRASGYRRRERRHVFAERFVRQLIDRFMKRMHQNRDVVVNGLLRDGIYVGIIAEYGRPQLDAAHAVIFDAAGASSESEFVLRGFK